MVACYRVGGTECSSAYMGSFEGGHHHLHYLHHSLKVKVKWLSHVRLFATPWTVAYQAPPSMGFSRQEYWSGLPFPSPGDLPDPGIESGSPAFQADALTSEPPGKLLYVPDSQFVTSDFFTIKIPCRDVQRYAGDSEVSKRLFKTSRVLLPNRDAKICSLIIIIKEK